MASPLAWWRTRGAQDDLDRFVGRWCYVETYHGAKVEGTIAELTRRSVVLRPAVLYWNARGGQPPMYAITDREILLPRYAVSLSRLMSREEAQLWAEAENAKLRRAYERDVGNYQ